MKKTCKKIKMPAYKFKRNAMFALKIHYVDVKKDWLGRVKKVILVPEDKDYDVIEFSEEFYNYFKPESGGYYVRTCMENLYINRFWFENTTEKV